MADRRWRMNKETLAHSNNTCASIWFSFVSHFFRVWANVCERVYVFILYDVKLLSASNNLFIEHNFSSDNYCLVIIIIKITTEGTTKGTERKKKNQKLHFTHSHSFLFRYMFIFNAWRSVLMWRFYISIFTFRFIHTI